MNVSPPKTFRRFNRSVLITLALIVTAFGFFNTWVNPLWVTPTPWTNNGFAEYRPIYRQQRTGKAGLVRAKDWDVAFFGSSRVDIAYNPALPEWGDLRVVNLAMSASTLPETAATVRYTLKHRSLDLAIVGIDLGDLTTDATKWRSTGFMESPLNPKGDSAERELRYIFGWSTFEASYKAMRNEVTGRLPEYTPLGHRLRHQDQADVRTIIYRDAIPHALRTTAQRHARYDGATEWKSSLLRQILDDCAEHGTRLVLVIPPNHATYIGVFHETGDPDPCFRADREALVKAAEASHASHPGSPEAVIWDFNDFHPLNAEPIPPHNVRMHWWLDGTHARKELGNIQLSRIMGWEVPEIGKDYGIRLNRDNLEQRIDSMRQGYLDFKRNHRDMWEWMVEQIDKYDTGVEIPSAGCLTDPS
ncbi:hypothetical protein [Haloferula sargassicola]|uniref:Uncharacterized protein n=1 Tax=Haloferula sargassicola TaxID=490096 RepID=A0ABP9UJC7_9BACT